MPKITKETRNSKETFIGGAGSVIPFRTKSTECSTKKSANEALDSALPKEFLAQIEQEAREQWGYQPEMDELGTSNNES